MARSKKYIKLLDFLILICYNYIEIKIGTRYFNYHILANKAFIERVLVPP